MPVYNGEITIEESVQSGLNQTYTNFELLIVDDASIDHTADVVRNLSSIDNRIKYTRNSQNLGVAITRNKAIQLAKGELIAFLDADDLWVTQKLEKQVSLFMENPRLAMTYSGYELIDKSSNSQKRMFLPPTTLTYGDLLKNNTIGCLTVVIKKKVISDLGFKQIGHEDYNLWLDILKKEGRIFGMSEVLAKYRLHTSLSSNKFKAAKWRWIIYREHQQLGLLKSLYYFSHYAISSFTKYKVID